MNSGAQALSLHSFHDFEPEHARDERQRIKCAEFCVHTARVQFATKAFTVHTTPLSERDENRRTGSAHSRTSDWKAPYARGSGKMC